MNWVEGCTHRRRHRHGLYVTYIQHACRCDRCRRAHSDYCRDRYRAIVSGEWDGWVDAAPVRWYVRWLHRNHMSAPAIAASSGVAIAVVRRLIWQCEGSPTKVHNLTAQALLGVVIGHYRVPDAAFVPSLGARRRLRGMAVDGILLTDLVEYTELPYPTLHSIRNNDKRHRIQAGIARRIAGAFEHFDGKVGPTSQYVLRARENGWAPSIAWGDDPAEKHFIDHPLSRACKFTYVDLEAVA